MGAVVQRGWEFNKSWGGPVPYIYWGQLEASAGRSDRRADRTGCENGQRFKFSPMPRTAIPSCHALCLSESTFISD